MPRKPKPTAPEIPAPEAPQPKAVETQTQDAPSTNKTGAQEVGVYANGQFIRSYSFEIHGKNFTKLAEEFAAQDEKRIVKKIR